MLSLAERYCVVHQQGFLPIFVRDHFDAVQLTEACVRAGARAVEITCQRGKVTDEIRRIREAFPNLLILVGSCVDDGPMLQFLRKRRPDVPAIGELCDIGVDGFVSAMPLSLETVARLSETHLVIPGVETVTEAVAAVEAGAHFAKLFNVSRVGEHRRVAFATSKPVYGLLPILATGNVTVDKIEPYVKAHVALVGAGWDRLLGQRYEAMQDRPDLDAMASICRSYLDTMAAARREHQPELSGNNAQQYLKSIPHYHPFDELLDP